MTTEKRFHKMHAKEVTREEWPGVTFFVSYSTPMAYIIDVSIVVNERKYSLSTTKQLNRWLREMMEKHGIAAMTPPKISDTEMRNRYAAFLYHRTPFDLSA